MKIVTSLGYRADLAGNGLEALEAVQRQRYDVVLMDGQTGTILSGGKEYYIRLVKGNQLSVVEAPEDTHGHA